MAIVCLYIENRQKNVRMLGRCCGLTGPDGMSNRDSSLSWPFSPPHISILFRADNWPSTNGVLSTWQSLVSTPLVGGEVPQPRPQKGKSRNHRRRQNQRGKAEMSRIKANPRSDSSSSSPFSLKGSP